MQFELLDKDTFSADDLLCRFSLQLRDAMETEERRDDGVWLRPAT